MSPADNLCKQFGPRLGLIGLIWIQTVWHFFFFFFFDCLTFWWYSWMNFSKQLILKKIRRQKCMQNYPAVTVKYTCMDPEGGGGGQGVQTLKNQHSMLGHHEHASKMPFKWHFAGGADDGPLIVVFGSSLPSSTKKNPKNVKVGPPLIKFSGSAHDIYMLNHLEYLSLTVLS